MNQLSGERYCSTTRKTYYRIWKLFNQFFLKLDNKPRCWEERLVQFTGFLVENKLQSASVKTYISAIKGVLREIGIKISEDNFLLTSMTRACRIKNDEVVNRFPITKGRLSLMLVEVEKFYDQQPYLSCLFQTIYSMACDSCKEHTHWCQ